MTRYRTRYPLESGNGVSVFDLRDGLYPERKKVLTLLPLPRTGESLTRLAEIIDARSSFRHPFLPPILDLAFRGRTPGLVTDRIEFPCLEKLKGALRYRDGLRIAILLADLLEQLHQREIRIGYVNPRKLFIDPAGSPLLNFLVHPGPGNTSLSAYSMRYAAPEYLETGRATPAGDRYSLGIVFHLLFTGKDPFLEIPPEELANRKSMIVPVPIKTLNPRISDRISLLSGLLLHPDPRLRPSTIRVLAALNAELPGIECPPAEPGSGIIGRKEEIRAFTRLLDEPSDRVDAVVIEGARGLGKSRLSRFFQTVARLQGYEIRPFPSPESGLEAERSPTGKRGKQLFCLGEEPPREDQGLPQLPPGGRTVILAERDSPSGTAGTESSIPLSGEGKRRIVRFRLQPLAAHEVSGIIEKCRGKTPNLPQAEELAAVSLGNPGMLMAVFEQFLASRELRREYGKWVLVPGELSESGMPESVGKVLRKHLETLSAGQKAVMNALAVAAGPLPFRRLKEILGKPEEEVTDIISRLRDSKLVRIDDGLDNPVVAVFHPWIEEAVSRLIPAAERERIHGRIASILKRDPDLRQQLSATAGICLHFLRSASPAKAVPYLPRALEYTLGNSSFRKALDLYEAALSRKILSLAPPDNWLTYVKLLLKTGQEKRCRDFIESGSGSGISRTLLFRLGHLLDSLDLDPREICPGLADSIAAIFSRTSILESLGTLPFKALPGTRTSHVFRSGSGGFAHTSIHEKARYCHQLYRMYLAQGKLERAFSCEIKSFRLSLSLGKKERADRRLLDLAAILLARDQLEQARRWISYGLVLARETGDMRTRLEGELLLAMIKRKAGRHLEAEYSLAVIRHLNETHCGNRELRREILLEEARNLTYRAKPEEALARINEYRRLAIGPARIHLEADADLLEARNLALLGKTREASLLLEASAGEDGTRHSLPAARRLLLIARIHLDSGRIPEAERAVRILLRDRVFLSPYKLAKLRILQSEISLARGNEAEAGVYANAALRLAGRHYFPHLAARACQLKSCCLSLRGNHGQAQAFAGRARALAALSDRPEQELPAFPTGSVTATASGKRSLDNFIAFLKDEPDPASICRKILTTILEAFPGSLPVLYHESNGSVLRFRPGDGETCSDDVPGLFRHYRGLRRCPEKGANGGTLLFPIGTSSRSSGLLSLDFPRGACIEESDYLFVRRMADLSAIALGRLDPAPGQAGAVPGGGLELADGRVIVGTAPGMQKVLSRLMSVADLDKTVLLQGESGTGKELLARALHDYSRRKSNRFIPINCAALPPELIENELFGHVRGSYTGADTPRAGLFEEAAGGTVFLDEISTLSLALQPRLLRVLENKTVRPLGSSQEKSIDVRVVAATNQDLKTMARDGGFRFDLYYRLNAFRIEIPPLRERKTDIGKICTDYLVRHPLRQERELSDEALEELARYDYPGNVRELLNIMENLICFSPSRVISGRDVRNHVAGKEPFERGGTASPARRIMEELSRGRVDFWEGVRDPFINREISREEVREIVAEGLKICGGRYRELLRCFNLPPGEYKKFLSFLEHHSCKVDFRRFRSVRKRQA